MRCHIVHRIKRHVQSARATDSEGSPRPLVILIRKLQVGLQARQKCNDHDLQNEVEKQKAEHCVHVALEDAVEEVCELSVHAQELNEAEDWHEHEQTHRQGLIGDRTRDFAQRHRVWRGLRDVASVRANQAHEAVEKVPAEDSQNVVLEAVPDRRPAHPGEKELEGHGAGDEQGQGKGAEDGREGPVGGAVELEIAGGRVAIQVAKERQNHHHGRVDRRSPLCVCKGESDCYEQSAKHSCQLVAGAEEARQ